MSGRTLVAAGLCGLALRTVLAGAADKFQQPHAGRPH